MASGVLRSALVLAAFGVGAIVLWHVATRWRPSPAHYPLQGIDLGENPPPIDWLGIRAAGADFAYLVATSGTRGRDRAFEANWEALPEAGLRRGAIHRYAWCEPARAQADLFNTTVPVAGDALPAAVALDGGDAGCDGTPDPETLLSGLRVFVAAVEAHTGKPVLLRVDRKTERRYAIATALDRPVWVLGDFVEPGYAGRPWRLWRASAHRRIDGVDGAVDWDVVAP